MALVTQSANLVRQKTYMINRNPGIFYALKGLFLHLSANKGNPDLFLKNIDGRVNASDGTNTTSQILVDAACTLYAIYLKKTGTVATWFKATDSATTATTNGGADISFVVTLASEEVLLQYPTGHSLANGLTVSENTTATGATGELLANRLDGYSIVSA